MYKALVIDDEPRACHVLEILVQKHLPEITAFGKATRPDEGIALIQRMKPNLIFLDVEMPQMNGFDVLNALDDWNFDIIFTTAYHRFALQAIKVSALDYLLKPIDIDDLRIAFDKFLYRQSALRQSTQLPAKDLIQNLVGNLNAPTIQQQKLPVPTTEGVHMLPIADIIRCEADSNYTFFYLTGNRRFCASRTLKEFDLMLKEHDFVRVHKSHLVNMRFVTLLERDGTVNLSDGTTLTMSRRTRQTLFSRSGE